MLFCGIDVIMRIQKDLVFPVREMFSSFPNNYSAGITSLESQLATSLEKSLEV